MDVDLYDSLDGQVALVTGATRGIGAAIASELSDLGAVVYAGARDTDDVTADGLRPLCLDVTEETEIAAAVGRIADEAGWLDVLVNNAGPRRQPSSSTRRRSPRSTRRSRRTSAVPSS